MVLSPVQHAQLLDYLALLARWGRVYNLTAVREPGQMLTQHVLDSLAVWPALQRLRRARAGGQEGLSAEVGHAAQGIGSMGEPTSSLAGDGPHEKPAGPVPPAAVLDPTGHAGAAGDGLRLLDVGSGAGLPGAVLAVVAPALRVTCVDAVGKKAGFVRQVAAELGLENLHAEHARVEELATGPGNAGFDVITSRAFASLADFVLASQRQLAPGGVWMAMKGVVPEGEIAALPAQAEVFHVEQLAVPGLPAQRCIVWMRRRG